MSPKKNNKEKRKIKCWSAWVPTEFSLAFKCKALDTGSANVEERQSRNLRSSASNTTVSLSSTDACKYHIVKHIFSGGDQTFVLCSKYEVKQMNYFSQACSPVPALSMHPFLVVNHLDHQGRELFPWQMGRKGLPSSWDSGVQVISVRQRNTQWGSDRSAGLWAEWWVFSFCLIYSSKCLTYTFEARK